MRSPFAELRRGLVVGEVYEAPNVKTLAVRLVDEVPPPRPGQFNMVYVHGLGEVPLSVSGVREGGRVVEHTVRAAGAVTRALVYREWRGGLIGLRGPYGRGWPLEEAEGHDLLVVAGGMGFAPLRPVLKWVAERRERYGRVNVLVGARTPRDLLFKYELESYRGLPGTRLLLSVDRPEGAWGGHVGLVTDLIRLADVDPGGSYAFVCGPEPMMVNAVKALRERGFREDRVFLSLERRMRCGTGFCGTCQLGHYFTCRDGPVFRLTEVSDYLAVEGV